VRISCSPPAASATAPTTSSRSCWARTGGTAPDSATSPCAPAARRAWACCAAACPWSTCPARPSGRSSASTSSSARCCRAPTPPRGRCCSRTRTAGSPAAAPAADSSSNPPAPCTAPTAAPERSCRTGGPARARRGRRADRAGGHGTGGAAVTGPAPAGGAPVSLRERAVPADRVEPLGEDAQRYLRQQRLPQLGETGQRRLAGARVAVIGAGGLGAPVLSYLAAAGVGEITLFDPDTVDGTNLHRQVLFTTADVGRAKAVAAAAHLRLQNPGVLVRAVVG